ncbi:TPA: DUF4019 domain-containing protein [Aeromonas salmonicida subsp. smithia]
MAEYLDIPRILSIGTIGLGFLLALLAFRLLNREQSETKSRDKMLNAITRFMIFSFSLCVIGLSSEIYRIYASSKISTPTQQMQLGYFVFLSPEELQSARTVAEQFLNQIDKKSFQEAYDGTPKQVKKLMGFDDFKSQAIRTSNLTGEIKARKFYLAQKGPGQTPDGISTLYYITFVSSYSNIINAADTVTLVKDGDVFKVVNYMKV